MNLALCHLSTTAITISIATMEGDQQQVKVCATGTQQVLRHACARQQPLQHKVAAHAYPLA